MNSVVDPNLAAILATITGIATLIVNAFILTKIREAHAEIKANTVETVKTAKAVNGVAHEIAAAQSGQAAAESFTAGEAAERSRGITRADDRLWPKT